MGPESVSAPREGKPSAREGRTGLGEQRAPLYARRRVITERATGEQRVEDRLQCAGGGAQSLGQRNDTGRQRKACAGECGAGPRVRTQNRVPASRSAHQTIGRSMEACTETLGTER